MDGKFISRSTLSRIEFRTQAANIRKTMRRVKRDLQAQASLYNLVTDYLGRMRSILEQILEIYASGDQDALRTAYQSSIDKLDEILRTLAELKKQSPTSQ